MAAMPLLGADRSEELRLQRRVGHLGLQSPPSPAAASRCKVNRTVDGATFSRRAISLPDTPAVLIEALAHLAHHCPLCWHGSPWHKPKERTLSGQQRRRAYRATSSRNSGRNHLGTPSDIKSDWCAHHCGFAGAAPESAIWATTSSGKALPPAICATKAVRSRRSRRLSASMVTCAAGRSRAAGTRGGTSRSAAPAGCGPARR